MNVCEIEPRLERYSRERARLRREERRLQRAIGARIIKVAKPFIEDWSHLGMGKAALFAKNKDRTLRSSWDSVKAYKIFVSEHGYDTTFMGVCEDAVIGDANSYCSTIIDFEEFSPDECLAATQAMHSSSNWYS